MVVRAGLPGSVQHSSQARTQRVRSSPQAYQSAVHLLSSSTYVTQSATRRGGMDGLLGDLNRGAATLATSAQVASANPMMTRCLNFMAPPTLRVRFKSLAVFSLGREHRDCLAVPAHGAHLTDSKEIYPSSPRTRCVFDVRLHRNASCVWEVKRVG